MHIDNTFAVTAPLDQVWETIMAVDRVAGCVPGAAVVALTEDTFEVTMRVKLGPILMQYKGTLEVIQRDASVHRAVVRGTAQEVMGQGTAEATVELRLAAAGAMTQGMVSAEIKLSGRAAAMGRGVITKVSEQLMAQFAENLQALLSPAPAEVADPAVPERSGATVVEGVQTLAAGSRSEGVLRSPEEATPKTAPVEQVEGDPAMTRGRRGTGSGGGSPTEVPRTRMPEATVSGGAQSSPAARVSDRVSASGERPVAPNLASGEQPGPPSPAGGQEPESLDVLALVRSTVRAQLGEPRVMLGLLLPAALVLGYLAGRRSRHR